MISLLTRSEVMKTLVHCVLARNALTADFFAAVTAATGRCEPDGFAYGSEAGVLAELDAAAEVFRTVLVGD
jgi:hypothetical protein